jgi:hypothetical protein
MAKKMTITPISDLVEASRGTLVELPPFVEGKPFVARLKRPSMLALVKSGKIPNALLNTANELFANGSYDTDNPEAMSSLFGVLDSICDACFVEPTYAELKDAGVELTDDQYMFVFNYTQRGVNALQSFRSQLEDPESAANVQAV